MSFSNEIKNIKKQFGESGNWFTSWRGGVFANLNQSTRAALVYIIHLLVNNPFKSATTIKKNMIALLDKA